MKLREKIMLAIAIMAIFALLVFAQPNWHTQQLLTRQTMAEWVVSATQANSAQSFGSGIYSKHILIINDDGTNEVFVDLDSTTAAVTDFEIKAGEKLEVDFVSTGIGLICNSGETATIRVIITY